MPSDAFTARSNGTTLNKHPVNRESLVSDAPWSRSLFMGVVDLPTPRSKCLCFSSLRGCTFRNQTVDNGHLGSRLWRTRLFNRQWSQFSTRFTREIFGACISFPNPKEHLSERTWHRVQ